MIGVTSDLKVFIVTFFAVASHNEAKNKKMSE